MASSDGYGNRFDYVGGTLSYGEIARRIAAINAGAWREPLRPAVEGALEWLHLALRRLPPDCATILFRHAVEAVPLSQIAEGLCVSVPTAERRLELARKRLREELIRLGHELGRLSGEPLAWIPCGTCRVPTACLSAVCSFSPRNPWQASPPLPNSDS